MPLISPLLSSSISSMEEELPHTVPMERATRIIRKSIHLFLQNYHYFTLTSALFAFPYSISFLISQDFVLSSSSSPLLPSLYTHFRTLFEAANFPTSSKFFAFVNLKLSQTISSSLLCLPFSLTFLLISKTLVFQSLSRTSSSVPLISSYRAILRTYICTWLVLLSANATAFFLLFFIFNALERFEISQSSSFSLFMGAFGAVIYSIIIANSMVVCGLGMVLSGVEGVGGSEAIVKACLMIQGRTSTALSLALPLNLALAATEALFQIRVSRSFHGVHGSSFFVAAEGLFIAYLYSVLIVLEAIVTYVFYKSCIFGNHCQEDQYNWNIQIPCSDETP